MTVSEVAAYLRAHDKYLILTHRRPDGDTLGCAAALCAMLRQMGKTAGILYNRETTEHFEQYVEQYWVADDFDYETVVSVDLAALSLFPDNAEMFKTRVDLAIDHHPSYEGFGKESCVHPECAACGEILCELAQELGQLTPEVALPLYVAVSTDTGCFVYSNVTANTHRVAAALMETGIDYKAANKLHFRTKSKKRLALEGELLRTMEFYDEDRVVIVAVPQSLQKSMALSEADMEDLASLGGLVEGTDCAVTMKETKDGAWKVSVRTGARVNATRACSFLGGGGHRAASGCLIEHADYETARAMILNATASAMAFRIMARADLDAVCRIYDQIHTAEERGEATIGWQRGVYPERETAEAALARGDLFVQEQNGEIVGTAILNQTQVDSYAGANWRYDAPDSEVMVLHTLVIDPEAKSRGLGREFAAFYEGYALAHGCRYLRIDTNARNARARRFYQKLGYAEIGVVPCTFNGIAGVQLVLLEKRLPPLRQITADEAPRLRACVQALSEHHNRVSVNFKGSYPSRPYDKTLSLFAQALEENVSRIAVIEEDSGIVGFCKVDLHGDGTGKLDYLVVLPQCRGRKYGKALMDWAMAVFSGSGVRKIEVKVVDGNDAVHLYEKYGFRMNAHILVRGE